MCFQKSGASSSPLVHTRLAWLCDSCHFCAAAVYCHACNYLHFSTSMINLHCRSWSDNKRHIAILFCCSLSHVFHLSHRLTQDTDKYNIHTYNQKCNLPYFSLKIYFLNSDPWLFSFSSLSGFLSSWRWSLTACAQNSAHAEMIAEWHSWRSVLLRVCCEWHH